MKVFAFALLLLVAVTYGKYRENSVYVFLYLNFYSALQVLLSSCITGEALHCVSCIREAPDSGDCVESVDTCPPEMDACAKITYPAPYGGLRRRIISSVMISLSLSLHNIK